MWKVLDTKKNVAGAGYALLWHLRGGPHPKVRDTFLGFRYIKYKRLRIQKLKFRENREANHLSL